MLHRTPQSLFDKSLLLLHHYYCKLICNQCYTEHLKVFLIRVYYCYTIIIVSLYVTCATQNTSTSFGLELLLLYHYYCKLICNQRYTELLNVFLTRVYYCYTIIIVRLYVTSATQNTSTSF